MKTTKWAKTNCVLALSALTALAVPAATTDVAARLENLPLNKWTLLPATSDAPSPFGALVYAPDRGQVLYWGRSKNVLAFDLAKSDWIPEAPGDSIALAESERPRLAQVYAGVCWDSKRRQVVYTLPGIMAAYDPQTRNWRDLRPKTVFGGWGCPAILADHFYEGPALVLAGDPQPGPPPCYGQSTCYDPLNDEILLFPHFGAANLDMAKLSGGISGHFGTLVYRFSDNTWRRVSDTFGSDETKKARRAIAALIGKVSKATDRDWSLRHRKDAARPEDVSQAFAEAVVELDRLSVPEAAKPMLAEAAAALKRAAEAATTGKWDDALAAGGRALWICDQMLDQPLRVEPSPRCGTPLVHDPKNQVIVMFGGHSGRVRHDLRAPGLGDGSPGRLNDTWLYDCKTRQWREVSKAHRPPPALWPKLVYDPASGLVLLVDWEAKVQDEKAGRAVTLWGFDATREEWRLLDRQTWPGDMCSTRHGSSLAEIALHQRAGLLVLAQQPEDGRGKPQTCVFRLDVSKLAAQPAPMLPPWIEPEPVRPQVIAPDDPAVLDRLKALPANKWIHVRPPHDGVDKGWGNAACDPVRGHIYYFGGGHSTYQVNDVAIYAPGVNRWFYAAGDHNDWIPPAYWDGTCMGLRGGPPAGHQRNYYCVVDGRMYVSTGAESRRWGAETAKLPGQRYSWFYDLDCGGVWRRLPVEVVREPNVAGVYGKANLAAPDGRIMGFGGALEPYNGRFFPGEVYLSCLDAIRNVVTVKKAGPGPLCCPGEDRPFCFMADRDQVFYYEFSGGKTTIERQVTWVYDVKTNAFANLKPRRHPPGSPRTVEYLDGQNAVFAVIGAGEQWVYSLRLNTWAPLALETDSAMGFAAPYAQVVYSAKYGVLVNVGSSSRGTAVMRPDLSHINWE